MASLREVKGPGTRSHQVRKKMSTGAQLLGKPHLTKAEGDNQPVTGQRGFQDPRVSCRDIATNSEKLGSCKRPVGRNQLLSDARS